MTNATSPAGATGRLAGRVAIVTGASRGLGHDIALGLAAEGAAVAVAARTLTPGPGLAGSATETAAEIRERGGNAEAFGCDVQDDGDLVALIMGTRDRLGSVDILVNNAALTVPGRLGAPPPAVSPGRAGPAVTIGGMPLKAYRPSFEVGLFPVFRLSQLVVPDMVAAGRGSIVNIGSDAAHTPGPGPWAHRGQPMLYGYGGSKIALEHLSHSLAYELASTGVTVNALLTSRPLDTPGLRHMAPGYSGSPTDSFVDATIRLASGETGLTPPSVYHQDLLHDRPPPPWLGGLRPVPAVP